MPASTPITSIASPAIENVIIHHGTTSDFNRDERCLSLWWEEIGDQKCAMDSQEIEEEHDRKESQIRYSGEKGDRDLEEAFLDSYLPGWHHLEGRSDLV